MEIHKSCSQFQSCRFCSKFISDTRNKHFIKNGRVEVSICDKCLEALKVAIKNA